MLIVKMLWSFSVSRSNYIKRYSVEIKSSFGKSGSGTLIKVDDKKCYLATAKHNFTEGEKEDSWRDLDELMLKNNLANIEVLKQNNKVCRVVDIEYSFEDLIIFSIDNHEEYTENLDNINILYEDNYHDDFEYFFHGYPVEKNKDDGFIDELRSRNSSENNRYLYDVNSSQSLRYSSLKGFSGSGVFINDGVKYYLVGVVLQRRDGLSSFTAFNLPKFLKDKNSLIPIKEDVVNLENLGDMYGRIVKRNSHNFLIKEHEKVLLDSYDYSKILDDTESLEQISIKLKYTNRLYELEADYKKELADMYLLGTVLSQHWGDETRAKEYFKKAREYEPNYIRYLKDLDIVFSKEELMREAKIAFVDANYRESKLIFRRCLHLYIEDNDRIYIYKKLVDIGKIQNNKKDTIEGYEKLLDLYEEDEKLIRAEIFYELSETTDSKSYQISVLRKGLTLIEYELSDDFLEIKYKLKRRENKLLKRDDIYFGLKSLLEKLSESNPKYNDEYRELYLRDSYKFEWRELLEKITQQIRWVWGFIFLVFLMLSLIYFFEYEPWYRVLTEFFSLFKSSIKII